MMNSKTFQQAMQESGIAPPADIIADGKLRRFNVAGDRAGSLNGWYVLHADPPAAGAFGTWKSGASGTWCAKAIQTMTANERTDYAAKMEAVKVAREREESQRHAECRAKADAIWKAAHDVDADHPYIVAKQIKPYGVKQSRDSLLVPVLNIDGTLQGLQFIGPDGNKRFLTGTAVQGSYLDLAIEKPNGAVLVCEGYATGATLREATHQAVAVAFNAGNLKLVAEALRAKLPETAIVICADDDHQTGGNPGITKAREAARAVNGLLAVPSFPGERGPGDTDFNDLARLAGPRAVKFCIESARPVDAPEGDKGDNVSPLDAAIKRLAALSPLEYDVCRKAEAKALGVRPGTLDVVVKAAQKAATGDDLPFTEVDAWAEPVDPAKLLYDIAFTVRRFIVCSEEVAEAVALWAAFTWFIDVVNVAPLAVITAPEKRCGKSQLLSIIGMLSARSITASSISPAALFRTIDKWQPTLMIDEVDAFMKDNEELRGLLNSGHTRDSAYVIRTVGEQFTPTKFNTWGAKALAGIGKVADTLMDRAIILELRRKLPEESVDRMRYAEPNLFEDLRAKLARFAEDYSEQVKQARPPLPHTLNDRAQDNWEPLLAIALVAGGDWLQIGTRAALKLSGGEGAAQTIGVELLADIQEIFNEKQTDRISTTELINALCEDDEKTWATYNRGFRIKPRQVATRLKSYGILSKTIRTGLTTPKGYELGQFAEAFSRYVDTEKNIVPSTPENDTYPPQPAPVLNLSVADSQKPSATHPQQTASIRNSETKNVACCGYEENVADMLRIEKHGKPAPVLNCGVVADNTPLPEENIFDLSADDLREAGFE